MAWNNGYIPQSEIEVKVTEKSVDFAKEFGTYLGTGSEKEKLTTNQLRKFFGEVKRQQMEGYNSTRFILLKPKLAYAVGRAKNQNAKINDFYRVIANAIDRVHDESQFKNFVQIFEAIVAYHKAAEEKIDL